MEVPLGRWGVSYVDIDLEFDLIVVIVTASSFVRI